MLTRAPRRRHAFRYFQQVAEQIQLPWLCPALSKELLQRRTTGSLTADRGARRPSAAPKSVASSRHLASSATASENIESNDHYIPFSFAHDQHFTTRFERHAISESAASDPLSYLRPYDPTNLVMIDHTTAEPMPKMSRRQRTEEKQKFEIRGDAQEVESTLDACLHVHQWDRALALLRQLTTYSKRNPYDLLLTHNRVFEWMVMDLVWNRNTRNLNRVNDWIEVEMKKAGLTPDARTLSLRIKAALATFTGAKRERTVRRYWDMAERLGLRDEVISLRDIFTDNNLGKLSEIGILGVSTGVDDGATEAEIALDIVDDAVIAHKPAEGSDVRAMQQKGLGLSTLKHSLSLFSDNSHLEGDSRRKSDANDLAYAQERQSRLETDAVQAALERWKSEHEKLSKMGISRGFEKGSTGAVLWQWHELMTEKLKKEMQLVTEAEAKQNRTPQQQLRCEYGPWLRELSPEQIAATSTIAALTIMSKRGVAKPIKMASLVVELGRTMEAEVEAEKALRNSKLRRAGSLLSGQQIERSRFHQTRKPQSGSRPYLDRGGWSIATHAKVGAVLCELLFDCAKLPIMQVDPATGKKVQKAQPVFQRQSIFSKGKKLGIVSLSQAMVDALVKEPPPSIITKQLPMVCSPKPWKGMQEGGFYESKTDFLRVKHQEHAQREYVDAAATRGDLDQLFAAIDVLGRTAWKVNPDIFRIMLDAWNSGEAIANLPPLEKVFPILPKPAEDASKEDRYKWYRQTRKMEDERSGLHSNRCFQNFQMEIARAYLGEEFYFPHNVDFRGRAYPIPPYLNQMGADNARGLLLFAQGRCLGPRGLRWLKIHLANVYGYDKASLADRESFPMTHLDDVLDSAENPLEGRRWWLTAEDPWQCLATCIELRNALKLEDPSEYVSHLPVHQDGSCNGLQHYAALGGDLAGAKQVNLEPGDKPADVYTGVAELVKADITKDASTGDSMAKLLEGRITRKIVKQTVMTNVYGVTFLGGIRQVAKQLEEYMPDLEHTVGIGRAAAYITRKIFKGLGQMFSGAREIQYWLGDAAGRVNMSISPAQQKQLAEQHSPKASAKLQDLPRLAARPRFLKPTKPFDPGAFRSTVIWTTPLKLPVVQPYRTHKGRRIKTHLQDIILEEPSVADAVNKRKQLQAFPPNFIHSLDATHMALSALKADELGLTFSAVHDSFWTHAANIDTMNHLLRDAFIRMHSEDIIGRLAAEFRLRYKGHLYLAQVPKDSPVGKKLVQYRKGLRHQQKGTLTGRQHFELLRETERKRLVASDSVDEQKRGQDMITASTICEELEGEKYLFSRDSLGETAIGMVPHTTNDQAVQEALLSGKDNEDVSIDEVLGPLVQEHEADAETNSDADFSGTVISEANAKKAKKARKSPDKLTWLWLPLTFREVPKKGLFDVARTRDSQYFFS